MKLHDRLHALHRIWRYRLRTERQELAFMLGRRFPPGGSVLDIGANRGIYSYWMHRRFARHAQIVAFEPQPELVDYLADFKRAFHLDRLTVEPLGLSSRPGTMTLLRPQDHWGAASFNAQVLAKANVVSVPVAVTTLDEYFSRHPELRPVRFIKCDVEQHEADVLLGGVETLREDRPELLLEWADEDALRRVELFELLRELGYRAERFTNRGRVPAVSAARQCGAETWDSYVFLSKTAVNDGKCQPAAPLSGYWGDFDNSRTLGRSAEVGARK
jgi:FkbM family methyltransferase